MHVKGYEHSSKRISDCLIIVSLKSKMVRKSI